MLLQEFLEKEEHKKFTIIYLLERSPHLSLFKEELLERLEVSSFVLSRLIDSILIDLARFDLSDSMHIIVENYEIILETDGTVSSDILLERYIRDSNRYQLLRASFFQNFKSLNEFSLYNSISYPIVHRSLRELNSFLEDFGIVINKKFQIEGEDELELRLFLTELFYRIEKSDYEFYDTQDDFFIKEQLRGLDLSDKTTFQIEKMTHYLFIVEFRVRHQQFISNTKKYTKKCLVECSENFLTLIETFFRRFNLSDFDFKQEVMALKLFYLSYYPEECFEEFVKEYPYVCQGADLLLEHLSKQFPMIVGYEKELAEFEKKVLEIHTYLLGVGLCHDSFVTSINLSYFKESYPDLFSFCRNYIILLNKKIPELYKNRKYLLFNYLLLILNTFPKEAIMETLSIHINFTLGNFYNQFIVGNIRFFEQTGALQVTSAEEADIVLTNSRDLALNSGKEYVAWLSPPRPVDWENLAQLIVNKRQEKMEQKIRQSMLK